MQSVRRPSKVAWLVTWGGFALGVGASVSANVAHARPQLLSQLVAAWAPVALFIVVETLIHVPSPRHWFPRVLRYVGSFIVAVVAIVGSYRHMVGTALGAGEDGLAAYTLPASVDAMVLVTSLSLLALADRRRAAAEPQALPLPSTAAESTAVLPLPSAATESTAVLPSAAAVPRSALEEAADVVDRAEAEIAAFDAMTSELWSSARSAYRRAGRALTGKDLGELFGKSERWGRDRILEARAGDLYRQSVHDGTPLDAEQLGKAVVQLGSSPRDRRWGGARIAEVEADDAAVTA